MNKPKKSYPDRIIKEWHCEACENVIAGKIFKTTEPSASFTHRKVYCEKCWKEV